MSEPIVQVRWSEQRDKIGAALVAFQAACPNVPKRETAKVDGREGKRGYEYAYCDIAAVRLHCRSHLTAAGLAVVQPPSGYAISTTVVHAESGQWFESTIYVPEPARTSDAQAWGSTITYFRRYAYLATLGIAADDDDDDAQKGSEKVQPPRAPAARPQPPERAPAGERREAPRQAQRAPAPAANVPDHVRAAMATRGPNTRDKQAQNVGDMSDDDMGYWIKRYTDNPGEGKWRDTNLRQLQAMLIVWRHRSGALHPLDPDSAQSQNRERQAGDDDEPYEGDGGGEDDIPY